MSKLQYSKPSVTRMGPVTEKTEGGWLVVRMEMMSYRA